MVAFQQLGSFFGVPEIKLVEHFKWGIAKVSVPFW